jgi:Xaa-Pro aminopeptidase
VLLEALKAHGEPQRLGVEFSMYGPHLSQHLSAPIVDLEPAIVRLRRKKGPDELARIRAAIVATGKMYVKAREIMRPGLSELEMFNTLQSVAVDSLGEPLTGTGNDYRCGARGGAPRNEVTAQAGELYILDLGPAFRGYFSDNARTIAVDGKPTADQKTAWKAIMEVLDMVRSDVKPGVSCKAVFERSQQMLDRCTLGEFNHHLGHGIGLFPHEGPHLNPFWDDTFEVGDVFTAEPGLYGPTLHAGIRLENDYLVTPSGVELLSDFPLEL